MRRDTRASGYSGSAGPLDAQACVPFSPVARRFPARMPFGRIGSRRAGDTRVSWKKGKFRWNSLGWLAPVESQSKSESSPRRISRGSVEISASNRFPRVLDLFPLADPPIYFPAFSLNRRPPTFDRGRNSRLTLRKIGNVGRRAISCHRLSETKKACFELGKKRMEVCASRDRRVVFRFTCNAFGEPLRR